MRGKNKIWTLTALFIATLAIASINIPTSYAQVLSTITLVDPLDGDSTFGPFPEPPGPDGPVFRVDVVIDEVENLRSLDFKLFWDQRVLQMVRPNGQPVPVANATEFGLLVEGELLKSIGQPTNPSASLGVAGEYVYFGDTIVPRDWVSGGGTLAILHFKVVGGGKTLLTFYDPYDPLHKITGRLFDQDFYEILPGEQTWSNGYYWGPFPFIGFTWFVPTAQELLPQDFVDVNGTTYEKVMDEDGDIDFVPGPSYIASRPTLNLNPTTGAPEQTNYVEGGTMFYGDEIIFDASYRGVDAGGRPIGSYDLDELGNPAPLDPNKFKWRIRAGGVDKFYYRKWYDTLYASDKVGDGKLDYGPTIHYTFPGPGTFGSSVYGIYSRLLGWHDLLITVTDANNHVSAYYTWIRIFRLVPARLVMLNIPNPKAHAGDTITIGGKIQNRGGTGWFPYDALTSYLELGRMIHGYIWARMKFEILNATMKPVTTLYSDAVWLGPTEDLINHLDTTWTIPGSTKHGTYYVKATAYFCGSGVTYGLKAVGLELKSFEILP